MKRFLPIILSLVLPCLFIPMRPAAASRIPGVEISKPELVRLTGTFHRPEESAKTGMYSFRVYIGGKEEWIFDVKKAQDLSGLEPGLDILNDLFPSTLNFWGPKKLVSQLEKPELDGQPVTVEGYIHVAHNIMEVTAVREAS